MIAANLMHFARVLRTAGLPIGPGHVLRAVEAVEAVGLERREDVYWALNAVFVNRQEQRELFDQAFHVFWRDPKLLERALSLLLPAVNVPAPERPELARRLADALHGHPREEPPLREEVEIEATLTCSDRERLQTKDFEKMSAEELAHAKQAMARLKLPRQAVPTRRFQPHPTGRAVDLRATLRRSLRLGSIELARRRRRTRPPPLVVLCDISGSMSRYSRLLLHFLHAVTNDRDRVYSFVFGTRLTNITRHLRHRDGDVALEKVSAAVRDWSGGTRIGATLHDFNTVWSRRVLSQGAVVLLITDGLDRDAGEGLAAEVERLRKSCRRLIWLNPLLRHAGFAPKASGIRAILPHVDDFRPIHNLDSLETLAQALDYKGPRRYGGMARWLDEIKETAA
ncbi:MAG TPA: VWA domain-containing protein [Azospirillaceae bacterium]|nr:VWA domain-containing protein [Azospirillaceae bacterium]